MKNSLNPKVIEVLSLLGVGTVLLASVAFPGVPIALGAASKLYKHMQYSDRKNTWERFNKSRLRYLLKRLYSQKVVEITEENDIQVVRLTEKGKTKLLKYDLEKLMIEKPPRWDKIWRLIIYDVGKEKKEAAAAFRRFIKKLEILQLQKSVYLTPYPCKKQIEFLREYYQIGSEVLFLEVKNLENDQIYRRYFGV